MPKPELWIIAGPNGAGETTFVEIARYEAGLPEGAFINPDAITLSYLREMGMESWKDAPPDVLKTTFMRAANHAECLLHERVAVWRHSLDRNRPRHAKTLEARH